MLSSVEILGVQIPNPSEILSALSGRIDTFLSQYRQWTEQASPELSQMRADLWVARSAFSAQGLTDVAQVDALAREIEQIQAEADTWGGTWGVLAEWFSGMFSAVGLSAAPILIAVSVTAAVSAVAALAYIISSWLNVRQRAASVIDIANRLQAGSLTTEQAEVLLQEPSWSGALGSLGGVGMLLVGLTVLWLVARGR